MSKTPEEWGASLPKYGASFTHVVWCSLPVYHAMCAVLGCVPEENPEGAVACVVRFGEPVEWHDGNGEVIR